MSEPDDVERLVAESLAFGEQYSRNGTRESRLARIVRELLAEHPRMECNFVEKRMANCYDRYGEGAVAKLAFWCTRCRNRDLRERLNSLARGEEA